MLKVGIIGCGRIAGGFEGDSERESPCTHAGAYALHPRVIVTAISDKSKEALIHFSKTWKINNTYLDYNQMLQSENLDMISICSDENSHYQMVLDASKSGVKLIFCEKPIAKNSAQAKEMISSCKKNNVKLVINHSRRWHNNFINVKSIIDSKEFGEIISITGRYTSGLRVMGTHMIDIMSFLCGKINSLNGVKQEKKVKGKLRYSENFSSEDPSYSVFMNFNNNIVGFLEGSCRKNYLLFEIDIHFSDGRISIVDNGKKLVFWRQNKGLLVNVPLNEVNLSSTMMNAVNSNVDCIELNSDSNSSGKDGLYTLNIIEKIIALNT